MLNLKGEISLAKHAASHLTLATANLTTKYIFTVGKQKDTLDTEKILFHVHLRIQTKHDVRIVKYLIHFYEQKSVVRT